MALDEPVAAVDSAASGGPGLGSQLMMLLLGGLAMLPGFLGALAAHDGGRPIYRWLGIVVSLAMLGSVLMVSRKLRRTVPGFGLALLVSIGANLVLLLVQLFAMDAPQGFGEWLLRCAWFLVVPLLATIYLAVRALLQRRRQRATTSS
ncbi:hypothetical protein [Luteococcus peritonei]|uniref:Uncharacterized protein n=1 Tax=Luteococcus peritonei TaxID=88874 RepID=A0ABW4RTX2_9ACTN